MLYFVINITGRFSVAIFGLTYNLVDDSVEKPSIFITNWTSSVLLTTNATDSEAVEEGYCKDSTLCENTPFYSHFY